MPHTILPHHTLITLPALSLEAGGAIEAPLASVWWWGGAEDEAALHDHGFVEEVPGEALRPIRRSRAQCALVRGPGSTCWEEKPTVLIVHALTGDRRAGGEGGWWSEVVGPGRALDPTCYRIFCINQLGSCYGSSGPGDEGFPTRAAQSPGNTRLPEGWPATVTTTDQARFLLRTLDALSVPSLDAVIGGSVGGMIAQAMVALEPARFQRLVSVASSMAGSPWIIGFNHIAKVELAHAWPHGEARRHHALEQARRLAHMTYRAEPGLEARQGRLHRPDEGTWSSTAPYAVQTYLDHQARKLRERFLPEAYVVQLDAMDHHDLERITGCEGAGLPLRWVPHTTCVAIDSDALYLPAQSERMVRWLRERGCNASLETLSSLHGHDAFLIEHKSMNPILRRALRTPQLP